MNKKILVIGEECEDKFVYGTCTRLSPEAPVPILIPEFEKTCRGMAGNVFDILTTLIHRHSSVPIQCEFITNPEKITKTRFVDQKSNQQFLRVDNEPSSVFELQDYEGIINPTLSAVLISDYNKGLLSETILEYIGSRCHELGIPCFLDTKKILGEWVYPFIVKINEVEYERTKEVRAEILEELDSRGHLIVTLGSKGCLWKTVRYPAKEPHSVFDVSGAGDVFLSTFVFRYLTVGIDSNRMISSLEWANYAASYSVTQKGTASIPSTFPDLS